MRPGRRVFISFLGVNYYMEAHYRFAGEKEGCVTRFVSHAILALTRSQWQAGDRIIVFLTRDARKKNWEDPAQQGHPNGSYAGLRSLLESLKLPTKIVPIEIPEGHTEQQLWDIFRQIADQLQENDRVHLDITHSFRSLPMLMMVMLNYAKELKNISVEKIYYGAFEALGPAHVVKKQYPRPADRKVDILDLTMYSDIQEWTGSIRQFLRTGDAQWLAEVIRKNTGESYKAGKGGPHIDHFQTIQKNIKQFTENIKTCRGKRIIANEEGVAINKALQEIEILQSKIDIPLLQPLMPFLEELSKKFKPFSRSNDVANGLAAVRFCIDHGLIQQGLTFLQETVISQIAYEAMGDYLKRENREKVSSLLHYKIAQKKDLSPDEKALITRSATLQKMMENSELAKKLSTLVDYRNTINHAGMRSNIPSFSKLEKKLGELYQFFATIFES